ncbi:anti-sigma factor family protein [Pandoraea pnomenusa]|uniref:anti-sigma factor family protein n=1 Tax=Pandoraea pnomenusa TaxID=93220 RepID=UPI00242C453E|nr:anti-sigma factor [Pandoraea pnomenusa]
MNEDDIRLLAYVDEALSPEARADVEAAIAASPVLADVVASLRASRLPYRETFAAQVMPPVPERLSAGLDALLREHAQRQTSAARTEAASELPASGKHDDTRRTPAANEPRGGRRVRAWWLGAAFAAGVAATVVALPIVSGVLSRPGENAGAGPMTTAAVDAPPKSPQGVTWVRAAADYQQLYVRDTVADLPVEARDVEQTVRDIRQSDSLDIRVPDLTAQGLSFRRVQRLRWQDRALVQMVYLPHVGDPIALCVVRDGRADQGVAEQTIDGMGVVTWRKGKLGYALIGAPGSSVDLKAVAKALAEGAVAPLYGLALPPDGTDGTRSQASS